MQMCHSFASSRLCAFVVAVMRMGTSANGTTALEVDRAAKYDYNAARH
jgi:hypothetical protein